jgi:hypothetical protein
MSDECLEMAEKAFIPKRMLGRECYLFPLKSWAARILPRRRPEARVIVPALLRCLQSTSEDLRVEDAYTLGESGTHDEAVVKRVALLLDDDSADSYR